MFSIIFFAFVALVLVVGFLTITARSRKNQNTGTTNSNPSNATGEPLRHSGSAFNEPRDRNIQDRIVPTQTSRNDLNAEKDAGDSEGAGDRPVY
ncbi:MAG: hypothetical protein J7502_00605 [Flavisolibacter sp.]|nr:hypothetical protein [Flavisolibacter sp.]